MFSGCCALCLNTTDVGRSGGRRELVAGLPFLGMVNKPLGDINCHQALGI